jgi:hypothetical protein
MREESVGVEGDKGDTPFARGDPTEAREFGGMNGLVHDLLIAHFAITPASLIREAY